MLVAIVAAVGPGISWAADVCPASAEPAETAPAPAGWRAWRSDEVRELRLVDVAFSDGPPEERAFITPGSSARRPGGRVDSYDFTSTSYRSVWHNCQYERTTIALVKETDVRGKRSQLSHRPDGGGQTRIAVSCR
ncbi:MAG: hypothetical protein JWQ33_1269 [Ramlibacter sp.]|nr:hypothetical protein [Ramlibacter sp.]